MAPSRRSSPRIGPSLWRIYLKRDPSDQSWGDVFSILLTPRVSCGVRTPALSAGRERAAGRQLQPVVRLLTHANGSSPKRERTHKGLSSPNAPTAAPTEA